jgi:hypothetical protein
MAAVSSAQAPKGDFGWFFFFPSFFLFLAYRPCGALLLDGKSSIMLIPKKSRVAVYSYVFKCTWSSFSWRCGLDWAVHFVDWDLIN